MTKKQKVTSLLLIAAFFVSMFALISTSSAVSTPSVPEVISVKFVDLSYAFAPVYGTDQYTGETVVKTAGYNVDNRSIAITIRNQPYTSSYINGNSTNLFFNFRVKGQYGTDANWDYYPFAEDGQSTSTYGGTFVPLSERTPAPAFSQSNGAETTITFTIPGVYRISADTTLGVQVQALDGYMYYWDRQYHFVGESSGWSETKTVTIGASSPQSTVTQAPTQTPIKPTPTPPATSAAISTPSNTPETISPTETAPQQNLPLDWQTTIIAILATAVAALVVIVAVLFKKNRTQKGGLYK